MNDVARMATPEDIEQLKKLGTDVIDETVHEIERVTLAIATRRGREMPAKVVLLAIMHAELRLAISLADELEIDEETLISTVVTVRANKVRT